MMNFIMLVAAIYLGLIAASITLVLLMASGWYVKLCAKMTKKVMENTFNDFE